MILIDDEQRRLHSRRSLRLMRLGMIVLVMVVLIAPIAAASLHSFLFLRFDLGFFIMAHGLIACMIAIVYWFIASEEHADRDYTMTTHI